MQLSATHWNHNGRYVNLNSPRSVYGKCSGQNSIRLLCYNCKFDFSSVFRRTSETLRSAMEF